MDLSVLFLESWESQLRSSTDCYDLESVVSSTQGTGIGVYSSVGETVVFLWGRLENSTHHKREEKLKRYPFCGLSRQSESPHFHSLMIGPVASQSGEE